MPSLFHKSKNNERAIKRKYILTLAPIFLSAVLISSVVTSVATNFIAKAANFSIKTGYYVGTGSPQTISGIGFSPDLIIIVPDTGAQGVYKTSSMPANYTSYFSATTPDTSTAITFNSDGFLLSNSAIVNTNNTRYTYTAFDGSDCTSTGTFCVGSYSGNGSSSRAISTGFQPAMVMVTRNNNLAASFKTKDMPSNNGQYFTTTAQATTLFPSSLSSSGFTVGSTNNANGGTYYYAAFKEINGMMRTGTYTGNGSARSITGFGAGSTPSLVLVKNSNGTTANRDPLINQTHYYGDFSASISSTINGITGGITTLSDNGFQVGTIARVNSTGSIIYWVAWGGEQASPSGAGAFKMATGTYSGNGSSGRQITGVGFEPNLVILKRDNNAQLAIFKTSLMNSTSASSYAFAANTSYTDAITALTSDGFTLGTNAVANASGGEYHWQAFGDAYNPNANTGSTDFIIGAYTGNGIDSRQISAPLSLDLISVQSSGSATSYWRTSSNVGDETNNFSATATATNLLQNISNDSFEVGTAGGVNTLNTLYYWFGFKNGANFKVGSYTGNGGVQKNYSPGFQPDLAWIKAATSQAGALRPSTLEGSSVQLFPATVNATNAFNKFVVNGFWLNSNAALTNANGVKYYYATWRKPTVGLLGVSIVNSNDDDVSTPTVEMNPIPASFACATATGSLGDSNQLIRVTNSTANPNWSLSIAPTGGANSLWASSSSKYYDFNDSNGTPIGCSDGIDTDSYAGRLSINPSTATATPIAGCSVAGGSFGTNASFSESINSITLVSTNNAETNCYWDLANFGISQTIPAGTGIDNYSLSLTITVTAN